MEHGVVDGRADVVAERPAAEGWLVVDVAGQRSRLDDHGLGPLVDVQEVGADGAAALQRLQDVGDQGTCLLRSGQPGGVEDLDHAVPFSRCRQLSRSFSTTAAIADVPGLPTSLKVRLDCLFVRGHDGRVTATRVPQEERTRAMRQRLLEASVECLVEHGWSGTSTTLVSPAGRGQPRRPAAPLPDQERPGGRRGRAPQRAARRRARGGGRGGCRPGGGAPARCSRCSPTTSPGRCSPPRSSSGSPPAPTRRCTRRSRRSSSGSAARRTGITVELLGVDESRPGVRELVQATLDLVRGLGLANTHHRRHRPPRPDPRPAGRAPSTPPCKETA